MQTLPTSKKHAAPTATRAASHYAYPWLPDCGDGTYCNPVIYADYSDPDVIRVGEDFYLTASSFNCTPGLPILHSKDLVNWTLVNHALKNLPHPRYEQVQPGCGVWAPAIRQHAGKYWIFYPTPDEGIFMVTAEHPTAKWSEPRLVQEGKGLIDPCPLWDDDGNAWLVHAYANSRSGIKHILRVRPMSPDGSKLLGDGEVVFQDPERHPTLEGPKFLKKDGWYFILAPAGGVEAGWQVALRSRKIYGPYEDKIVLAQGDTDINGPHQGSLVDTPDNGWWFMHFQDAGLYGRVTHLQPVHWEDDWPVMGKHGEPVLRHAKPVASAGKACAPQNSDEFDASGLGLQWQWHANHRDDWCSLAARPGWLRLFPQIAQTALGLQPNLLLQKLPARSFAAETILELLPSQSGEEAGIVIVGKSFTALGLLHEGTTNRIVLRNHDEVTFLSETASNSIRLRMEIQNGGKCIFGFAEKGDFVFTPQAFQAVPGTWIGAKVGLYSIKRGEHPSAGHADFDYFRFCESDL
jgi:beta-xylosidase